MNKVKIFSTKEALALAAAKMIISSSLTAINKYGSFNLVLAGGSTPNRTYEILAHKEFAEKVNWRKTQIFFGDERCVPLHHPDSNYDNISRRLLIHIPIPEENIHLIRCGSSLQKAASDYEKLLKRQLHARSNTAKNSTAGPIALFDITLLGLGEDGHTASLFPEATALSTTKNWVQPVIHQKPPPPIVNRVTLTPKAFNLSFQVVFLVSGKNKSPIIGKFLSSSPKQSATLPPHLIKPIHGDVFWFLDKAAAERL